MQVQGVLEAVVRHAHKRIDANLDVVCREQESGVRSSVECIERHDAARYVLLVATDLAKHLLIEVLHGIVDILRRQALPSLVWCLCPVELEGCNTISCGCK